MINDKKIKPIGILTLLSYTEVLHYIKISYLVMNLVQDDATESLNFENFTASNRFLDLQCVLLLLSFKRYLILLFSSVDRPKVTISTMQPIKNFVF